MRRSRGFTLIEIMVVMVVVGLMAVIAVVNMGGGAQQRELENAARELFLLMQTASEQAVLNNQEMGLVIDDESYRFLAFNSLERVWEPQEERLFSAREVPEWMALTYQTEDNLPTLPGVEDDEDAPRPDLVFFSSGEITPFEMQMTAGDNSDLVYSIESDGLNGLDWRTPGDEDEL
ncbi:GspH family T2SS minor pseudopilin variant XcpU [Marinobacter nanhaiticus D15-8W]|uniref:Type II secretion system protein H n=1 Tax=Marinobacter nanhaiticus D15-8W TaxID=626887 RepID=N6WSB0_9GAMM|nr:type II secretion system minor pseudopilin GspH [Marinobacter nanhaiticus]ENO13922.1 type II secretion system protein GspH [Marinobacter nanhaiticus D15-8W]BES71299.1 GspH family T2SS minor pseudopilin variant XcpU [Marinobacter nanhaiticus D15-8W]